MIRDPLTGEWALLGSTRSARPNEFRDGPEERCPFCPGNEDLTPPEIVRIGTTDRWDVRVFPNKFPAIVPPHGEHEVIVDSPQHGEEMSEAGCAMWRARYVASLEREPASFAVLFKNSGADAGATILHPHTQLIVLPDRPERWKRIVERGNTCSLCDESARAADEEAIVMETASALSFVRSHSRFAWSLTVLPRDCAPSILDATDAAWNNIVSVARQAVRAIPAAFGERAAFNLLLYSDPHSNGSFHWHMEIVPRLSTLAGFELSTGMFIRGATAKESARRWRRMIAPPDGSI